MDRFSRSSIKEKISRRSISTPKLRAQEKEHPSRVPAFHGTPVSKQAERDSTDFMKADSHAENYSQEINKLITNGNSPNSRKNEYICTSTESTSDIFFSRDCRAPLEKTSVKHNNIDESFTSDSHVDADNDGAVTQSNSSNLVRTSQFVSVRTGLSRKTTNTSYATGRHSQISRTTTLSSHADRFSGDSGKFSDFTGKLVGGVMKFTSNMQKAQNDAWLPCMTGKLCRKPRSPNSKAVDESESTFIQKAIVVEKIRLFWADKYRPRTLSGFTCHREQIQQLKQLVTPSTSFLTTRVLLIIDFLFLPQPCN
jgi:replication factor C subunit 3/5